MKKTEPAHPVSDAERRDDERRETERRRASRRAHRRIRIPAAENDGDRRAAERREGLG